MLALVLAFLWPLLDLLAYAVRSKLYYFFFPVPPIGLYLARRRMREISSNLGSSPKLGLISLSIGALIMGSYYTMAGHGRKVNHNDYLSFTIYAFAAFLTSGCFKFLGRKAVAFLFLTAPLPSFPTAFSSNCLQRASVAVAYLPLLFLGTPVLKDGLLFQLPRTWLCGDTAWAGRPRGRKR